MPFENKLYSEPLAHSFTTSLGSLYKERPTSCLFWVVLCYIPISVKSWGGRETVWDMVSGVLITQGMALPLSYESGMFRGGEEYHNELWQLSITSRVEGTRLSVTSRVEGTRARVTFLRPHTRLLRGSAFSFPLPAVPSMFPALTLAIHLLLPCAYLLEMNSTRYSGSKCDSCSENPLQCALWKHSTSLPLMAIFFSLQAWLI